MANPKVITYRNLPAYLPITRTLVALLALDYWGAPQWLWGVVVFIVALDWAKQLYLFTIEDTVNIFPATEEAEQEPQEKESKFQRRLQEVLNREKKTT
jgi:hypothetical protein